MKGGVVWPLKIQDTSLGQGGKYLDTYGAGGSPSIPHTA